MAYDSPAGIVAASVTLELLAIICVCLRFLSNRQSKISPTASDYLIIAALVCSTGLTVLEIYGASVKALAVPLGGTLADAKAVNGRLNTAKHIELAFLLLGILTLGLIKLSVSFLYWRIFARPAFPIFRRAMIVWIIILIVWTASFVMAGLLECGSHLLALFGTPQEYLQSCGSAIRSGYAMVGSDMATDLITIIIPLPKIWGLQLPFKQKLGVILLFIVGFLSLGASVAKAYIYITASLGYYHEDAILTLTGLSIWNLVEVQVGIIAACGTTMRPALSRMGANLSISSLLGSLGSRSNGRHAYTTDKASDHTSGPYRKAISDDSLVRTKTKDSKTMIATTKDELELMSNMPETLHVHLTTGTSS